MRMFSPLCGRSELADKDVVLVERLDGRDDKKREHQELKVGACKALAQQVRGGVFHTQNVCQWLTLHGLLTLQAVVFVRPTRANLVLLKRELQAPRFQLSHVCEWALVAALWQCQPLFNACACSLQSGGLLGFLC
jgi:hypothetical protein